ncbi:ATP-binding cassette domain-containing protein [uncultured Sunxiuqinia sp.]|uniref:ATP-binding cassette domain-containing protein n=1 Tax=uncultured Sunxiuqinia sp. TaxID=1573825 RepID=UPI0037484FA8
MSFTVNKHEKVTLIGNSGVGKSTLLKIISRDLLHYGGQLIVDSKPYCIPQVFGQYDHLTISQALNIREN